VGGVSGLRSPGVGAPLPRGGPELTDHDDAPEDDDAPERAAKGLLRGWIVAKTTPWLVRLTIWLAWLAAFAAYALYVWWRVRRMLRAEGRAAGGGDRLEVPATGGSR
jgi:hypothetical protein